MSHATGPVAPAPLGALVCALCGRVSALRIPVLDHLAARDRRRDAWLQRRVARRPRPRTGAS